MTQGKRFGLSAAQERDVWRRWKAGQSLQAAKDPRGDRRSADRRVDRHDRMALYL
jgi:hypothetical protein